MTNEEAIKHITTWLYAAPALPPMQVVQALELAVTALRAGGKDMNVPTMPAGQPLTLEQLRGMDGKCVKIVVDGQEPLEMLALVEAPEDEDCALLRNNLGGVSEFYSDEDLREDGVKAYAYPPAHIDREAWEPCGLCEKQRKVFNEEFCGECGRPLTEEAWEKLEKRVMGVKYYGA